MMKKICVGNLFHGAIGMVLGSEPVCIYMSDKVEKKCV